MTEEKTSKDDRRKDISEYGEVLSENDIREYLGITKADAHRIMNDPKLKKISVPIRKQLVNKQIFLEYLQ